jgi:hypothetical protein
MITSTISAVAARSGSSSLVEELLRLDDIGHEGIDHCGSHLRRHSRNHSLPAQEWFYAFELHGIEHHLERKDLGCPPD